MGASEGTIPTRGGVCSNLAFSLPRLMRRSLPMSSHAPPRAGQPTIVSTYCVPEGFPGGSVVRNPPASAGDSRDRGSTPGLGRSPGGEHGNPLQYSCLENPLDRGAWRATVHGVAKSRTRLSNKTAATNVCQTLDTSARVLNRHVLLVFTEVLW